jgi:hypothetical protein
MPSSGWAMTKHFLPGSTSAQPPLTQHRHSSVLMSSAHPRAQTPSKCCSGCSPSPHPCSVPVLGPYYDWIPALCPYLPSHEFDQLYAMLCQGPIWGSQAPKTCHLQETGHNLPVAHPLLRLWVYPVLCYTRLARPLSSDARATHISFFVMSVPRLHLILYFCRSALIFLRHCVCLSFMNTYYKVFY